MTTILQAQQKKTVSTASTLTNATVYFGYGAELTHTAKANLQAGMQEIVIDNIATQVDANTIQVACPDNVVLMSYRFAIKPVKPIEVVKAPLIIKMQDSVKLLQKQVVVIENKSATTEDLLARTTRMIESNATNNPKKEISSGELIKLNEYYLAQVKSLKLILFDLAQKKSDLQEQINGINSRIEGINALTENPYTPSNPAGQIILQVMTKSATTAQFDLSYFTNNAGWIPTYELRVKTVDNSCRLAYKAAVTQTTGIDWKNVKLRLTSTNPNIGGSTPVLNPWFLNLYVPVLYNNMRNAPAAALPRRSMSKSIVVADAVGGYEQQDEEKTAGTTSDVSAYTTVAQTALNVSFEIDLPYDIPSDGKSYSVSIKDEQVKAGYTEYSVPKMDKDAFMVAEINDWEKLDLMPGDVNIVMDNVYIGKSFIDPNTTVDTLQLSLGRDRRVAIKRMLIKEKSKSKVKGDIKTEMFTYEIAVKNNKKDAVDLVLKDQYPLSTVKEVETTLENDGHADVDSETGVLQWKMKLQPGESKNIRFSYSVKYPKDKVIQNLR